MIWGEIAISKRRIVDYAGRVLLLCDNYGQGGWTHIDGNEDWVVIVSGSAEAAILAKEIRSDTGDGLLLENR